MEKTKYVIDLSKWNVVGDYRDLMPEAHGVILRLGYRSKAEGQIKLDPRFEEHLKALQNLKMPIGIYFFTTAVNTQEAVAEARYVIQAIKKYKIDPAFPIAIDTEYSDKDHTGRSDKLPKEIRTNCVCAFCEEIKKNGYQPMIYASDSWFVSELDYSVVKRYQKWVARYGKKPQYAIDGVVGWQYTDAHVVKGKKYDRSEWYGIISPLNNQKKESPAVETPSVDVTYQYNLIDVPLYSSSTSKTPRRRISGVYYAWDKKVISGRIRITSKPEYVGVPGQITGWIAVNP